VVLVERPNYQPLTIEKLAEEVGLPLAGLVDEQRNPIILCLDHVLRDLARHGFVLYESGNHTIGYRSTARKFRVESLTSTWPELRSGFLMPEDEDFLVALAELSEQPSEDHADVAEVDAQDVFAALGWNWDGSKAVAIFGHLAELFFVTGRVYGGPSVFVRVTYAGLVRAHDDTGAILREAEDHFHAGRLRAAGCIAAVELERRLKLIAPPPVVSKRRDAGLEDYNKSAFDAGVIDQETWEQVSALAVIRKRCVHVLDREPEIEEVRRLIDGVDRILRRFVAP
jgi:hypothetical protein